MWTRKELLIGFAAFANLYVFIRYGFDNPFWGLAGAMIAILLTFVPAWGRQRGKTYMRFIPSFSLTYDDLWCVASYGHDAVFIAYDVTLRGAMKRWGYGVTKTNGASFAPDIQPWSNTELLFNKKAPERKRRGS